MPHDDYPIRNDLTRSQVVFQSSRVRKNKKEPNTKSDVTFIYQINLGMWLPGVSSFKKKIKKKNQVGNLSSNFNVFIKND